MTTISPHPPHRVDRPVMTMGWRRLTYVHWRYDPDVVARLLPDGLEPDLYEGSAWVGLIPFQMERIRFGRLPAVPKWSSFPETNVRTYAVDASGRRGVWFMSLDIDRLAPTLVARGGYGLPYCWGPMSIEVQGRRITYRGIRRWPDSAHSRMVVEVSDPIAPDDVDDLTHFLSARWGLYSTLGSRVLWAPVSHPRWPLREASLLDLDESLLAAAGLPAPECEPHVRFSPGVRVRAGRPVLA